jgi:hypothetical protein
LQTKIRYVLELVLAFGRGVCVDKCRGALSSAQWIMMVKCLSRYEKYWDNKVPRLGLWSGMVSQR